MMTPQKPEDITELIVHATATPPDMNWGAEEIRRVHVDEKGFDDIGYHYVLLRDGTLEIGRPPELQGAHTYGHNRNTIGIVLVGGARRLETALISEFNFTDEQMSELNKFRALGLPMVGHNKYDSHKDCPCFDVEHWDKTGEIMEIGGRIW